MASSIPLPLPLHLHLTVRFSSSHPDIDLSIPSPATTPTAALKLLIRAQLPPSYAQRKLRFIHHGRVLQDGAALSSVVPPAPPPPPPRRTPTRDNDDNDDWDHATSPHGSKGKAKDISLPLPPRVIINCAIGTADVTLTAAELAAESTAAHLPPATTTLPASPASFLPRPARLNMTPAPRGFDRLAATGLSRDEIVELRRHFVALQARRHTPDEMPSPDSLRRIEDAWIDGNVGAPNEDVQALMLEDDEPNRLFGAPDGFVGGMAIGFFFPVGAMVWVLRERGMLTYHRGLYVVLGLMLAVATGLMRGFSGGDDDGR